MNDRPRFKLAGRTMMAMGMSPLALLIAFFVAVRLGATFGFGSAEIAWIIVFLGVVTVFGLVFSAIGFVLSLL